VGTTKFDALIREVSSAACQEELLARGYTQLLVQKGKGTFSPTEVGGAGSPSDALTELESLAKSLKDTNANVCQLKQVLISAHLHSPIPLRAGQCSARVCAGSEQSLTSPHLWQPT